MHLLLLVQKVQLEGSTFTTIHPSQHKSVIRLRYG